VASPTIHVFRQSVCRQIIGFVSLAVLVGGASAPLRGQEPPGGPSLPRLIDGAPQPPTAPAVIVRDDAGRATVRAQRVTEAPSIDGQLDEAIYSRMPAITDFIQVDPENGAQATQRTEAWVLFDDSNVYVAVRAWESNPERMVATELRRDNGTIYSQNDGVTFIFDTFYNRRDGQLFVITPIGGRFDGQYTNERQYNSDFNPIWDVSTGRFDGGWSFEAAIPFKSMRYPAGGPQVWGFNMLRNNRWKNELSTITHLPPARGVNAVTQSSMAATLVGIEAPARSRDIEIKPYVIGDLTSDVTAQPATSNEPDGDVGIDVKFSVTQGLTGDVTYNPDFAQVEADEQQVNLTRFNLFFPEKRDFFLENQGVFSVGTTGLRGGADTPVLFYSRRIGIAGQREVPLDLGGRVTGRVGRYAIGLLNIQADEQPLANVRSTNFSVLRVRRDVLRRSNIGAMYTGRSVAESGVGRNDMVALDGNFGFFTDLSIATYWAQTWTDGRVRGDQSYRAQLDYTADRYGLIVERLVVEPDFNPEVGFVRRSDMEKSYAQFRFSPRPSNLPAIRKFSGVGTIDYIENTNGRLETRLVTGEFGIEFQNSDLFSISYTDTHEFLPRAFPIAPPIVLPSAAYDYGNAVVAYTFGQQRPLSGQVAVERGSFYNGDKTTVSVSRGRIKLAPQFSIEPSISLNWVDLDQGSFVSQVIGSRVTYSMSPRMFTSALIQYNSSNRTASSSIRFRWEYLPGSELFLVYNDQRDTLAPSFPDLINRSVVVKVNRLFRF